MPQSLTEQLSREQQVAQLDKDWATNPRWKGIKRGYSGADVVRLRGSFQVEHTLARRGAEKLWDLLHDEPYVNCLGALTGGQAMQQVKAGVKAIYLSGWQVAADSNEYSAMYPDQSLYPVDSVPKVVERINNSFTRADEIQWSKGVGPGDKGYIDYHAPIVADASRGRGRLQGRVLVVDDNSVNRKILARQLELSGLSTDSAAGGEEALVLWNQGGYDLVLADLQMPTMDGFELARRIRDSEASEQRPRTPILAVTASTLEEQELKSRAVGMDGFITKPIGIEQLRATLDVWLKGARSETGGERTK